MIKLNKLTIKQFFIHRRIEAGLGNVIFEEAYSFVVKNQKSLNGDDMKKELIS